MANNTVFFPGYSAGENAYKEIDKVCSPYGTKAVVISDEISINATKKYLDEATQDGIVKIDYILFPGEASFLSGRRQGNRYRQAAGTQNE